MTRRAPRILSVIGCASAVAALALACAPHADDEGPGPVTVVPEPQPYPEPNPEPNPFPGPEEMEQVSKPSISSVYVVHDCPAPPAAKRAPDTVDMAADMDEASVPKGASLRASGCRESTMQMAFTPHVGPGNVVIRSLRMLSADGSKSLTKIDSRNPTHWTTDGGYEPWNMRLEPGQEKQAAFIISGFDWATVERKVGSSWGQMFVLEAEVEIDGVLRTVRSPEFSRDDPDMVVT